MSATQRAAYPTRAKIVGTIAAARVAGIDVGGFEVDPDGTIRILAKAEARVDNSFDRWKAKQAKAS